MLKIQSRVLTASISRCGASLTGLWYAGQENSLVLGTQHEQAYKNELTYFGAIVGPIANRVRDAVVSLENQTWFMQSNEGPTCLHGGNRGTHALEWDVVDQKENAVTLHCRLAHGVGGLPGNREIEARYEVTDTGILRLEISASSDRTTFMNLAHHPYWNLDGSPTIAKHKLQVFTDHYLPVDDLNLPTGALKKVAGSAFDFRTAKSIPTDITLDHNFCLDRKKNRTPKRCAILAAPSGLRLSVDTTEPGLQVYNGAGLAATKSALHDQRILRPHAGIALEPQGWPDAPNNATFPSVLLGPSGRYTQSSVYHVSS